MERYDLVIIGGGAAGINALKTAVTLEAPVVLVDRGPLVGAGAIGLEMAGAFSDFGADVTVIGQESEILPAFDPDIAAYVRRILESRRVTFHLGATVTGFSGTRGAVTTHFTLHGEPRALTADQTCLAIGRRWRPVTLGAERLGLELGHLGLKVSPYLRTSVAHIYAAGDAAGNTQLTPVAAYEGRLAAHNALEGDRLTIDERIVPQTIFTTPEVAKVGLTHREVEASGVRCHVATHDMRGASNGRATGEDDGYLKLVFDAIHERLLGVQMVNYAGAELIQMAAMAIRSGMTSDALAAQLSVHPSQTERFIKFAAHDHHEICEMPARA